MKTVIRSFLPALAVLSLVFFSGPASAGMIATPKAAGGEVPARQAAIELLQSRLAEGGVALPPEAMESLEMMPTADLLALSSAAGLRAGRHDGAWIWWSIAIFVLLWWAIDDGIAHLRHRHPHHHHRPWE